MTADLAVIIVTWNTRELTLNALRTLNSDLAAHGPEAEVWVIDNASTDGTAQAIRHQFPQVKLVISNKNLGFAGANNHVMRLIGFGTEPSTRGYDPVQLPNAVYLLNPDTLTQPGATRALYDALFRLPKAGVVGAQLVYEDGAFQHGAFHFPDLGQLIVDLLPVPGRLHESAFNGRYDQAAYERGEPFPVDHTLGATMMLRSEVIQQTGMFDERYFMYCEEIDWSFRIRARGWEIYTIPAARVTHLAGQSTRQIRPQSVINLWKSRILLFQNHYSPAKRWLARRIIRLGMWRKIYQARAAYKAGTLSTTERDALIDAYKTVQTL